jgi:hypothetical protein
MQFWDYFTHFQWAKAQPELRRDLKAMDVGAFYEWYFGQMNARAMASTGRRLEEIDPFTPALLSLEREWACCRLCLGSRWRLTRRSSSCHSTNCS